jgi:probable DNA metabolism protein
VKSLSAPGHIKVISDEEKAERVWKGLKNKLSADGLRIIYWCFLSDINGVEDSLLRFIQYVFISEKNIERDYANADVLELSKLAEKIGREKLRFVSFVRFENIGRDVYYSPVECIYNVLPLVAPNFRKSYGDENWIIYDIKRKYGIYHNKQEKCMSEVIIDFASEYREDVIIRFEPDEIKYQLLWQNYFKNSNIAFKKNAALHLKQLPVKDWKYLTGKKQVHQ